MSNLRITPEHIDAMIVNQQYHQFPGTTLIACALTLTVGHHMVVGYSRPVDESNFKYKLGQAAALKNARDQIWEVAGTALRLALARTDGYRDPGPFFVVNALDLSYSQDGSLVPTPKAAVTSTGPAVEDEHTLAPENREPSKKTKGDLIALLRERNAEALKKIEALEQLCAAAYQMAGIVNAPVRFLDALSDAANGELGARVLTDNLLPINANESGSFYADMPPAKNRRVYHITAGAADWNPTTAQLKALEDQFKDAKFDDNGNAFVATRVEANVSVLDLF